MHGVLLAPRTGNLILKMLYFSVFTMQYKNIVSLFEIGISIPRHASTILVQAS